MQYIMSPCGEYVWWKKNRGVRGLDPVVDGFLFAFFAFAGGIVTVELDGGRLGVFLVASWTCNLVLGKNKISYC